LEATDTLKRELQTRLQRQNENCCLAVAGPCIPPKNGYGLCVKLTAVIHPDKETDRLAAECPEPGTGSQGHTEEDKPTTSTTTPCRF